MKKKINYEPLIPIIILGLALFVGIIINIGTSETINSNTTEITEESYIGVATFTDVTTPTDLSENIDIPEEEITEEIITTEIETTEETPTTEYYIEPTTEDYVEPTTETPIAESPEGMTYIGTYELTAYCPCEYCCGKTDGITASGTQATAGRTVGCNSLPFGTVISINGHQYVVEDRGGMSSNVIDIFFNTHQEALNFGRQTADVYIVN